MKKILPVILLLSILLTVVSCGKNAASERQFDGTVREEIREVAERFEDFVDEYCEFMKSFDASDLTMLDSYLEYSGKQSELTEEFNGLWDLDLTPDEVRYLDEVRDRCAEKTRAIGSE